MAPRIIEFVGLPGAGKTTLAAQLAAGLRAQGYVVFGRDDLDALVFAGLAGPTPLGTFARAVARECRVPPLARAYTRFAWDLRPFGLDVLRRLTLVSQRVGFMQQAAGRLGADFVVLDEWVLHEVWLTLLGRRPLSPGSLTAFAGAVAARWSPHVIVRCDVDLAVAAARVAARRSESALDGLPSTVLEDRFAEAERQARPLFDAFRHCRTLTVGGSVVEAEYAARLAVTLTGHCENRAVVC